MKKLLFLLAMSLSWLTSFAQFSGSGNGTETDPYLIFNEAQLAQVSNFLNQEGVVFKLMKDLDLTAWIAENNPSQGWLPIGVESMPFNGKFLGNDHKITGLMINRSSTSNVGFFGYVSGAIIENLTVEGSRVVGDSNTGGFIGYATGTEITNCNLTLSATTGVEGTTNVGGFVGMSYNSQFTNFNVQTSVNGESCLGGFVGSDEGGVYNQGSMTGQRTSTRNYNGGFAGKMTSSSVTDIQQIGDVSGVDYTGGFVGWCSNGNFTRCSVESDVHGGYYISGFAGALETTASSFASCYHKGTITATGDYAGGIVGVSSGGCIESMESCSHFGDMIGVNYMGGIIGAVLNVAEVPQIKTYYIYHKYVSSGRIETYATYHDDLTSGATYAKIVNNCTVTCNILGVSYIGGIIGHDYPAYNYSRLSHSVTIPDATYDKNNRLASTYYYSDTPRCYYTYYRDIISLSLTNNSYCGKLQGKENVGGIVGYKSGGDVRNNFAYTQVFGSKHVGGIVGQVNHDYTSSSYITVYNTTTIKSNIANVITVSATANDVGRIYGSVVGSDNVTFGALGSTESNRALAQAQVILSGVTQEVEDNLQNGTSIGPSAMKLKANYVAWGWNFDDNWNILETECYPYKKYQAAPPIIESDLVSQATSITGKSIDGGTVYLYYKDRNAVSTECSNYHWAFNTEHLQSGAVVQIYADVDNLAPSYFTTETVQYPGDGTEESPWRIYTAEDLQGASNRGYYKVMNDIDLTQWIEENSPEKGWVPIGRNSGDATYIDGGYHTITGLWINTTENYNGLFSNFSKGQIKNLKVDVASGKTVKGGDYTGILIGRNANGSIMNCVVNGDVEGTVHVGGAAGYALNTTVQNVTFNGNVSSSTESAFVGGTFGYTDGCTMTQCRATAGVSATNSNNRVGGLVGYAKNGTIDKSIVDVTVEATGENGYVGGLVGYSEATTNQCVSLGDVSATGDESYTGGLVGYALSPISDCYSTVTVKGTLFSAGLVGYTFSN